MALSYTDIDKLEITSFGQIVEGHLGNSFDTYNLNTTSFGMPIVAYQVSGTSPAVVDGNPMMLMMVCGNN